MVLAASRDLPVGTLLGEEDWTELGIEGRSGAAQPHCRRRRRGGGHTPTAYVVREAVASGTPLTWQVPGRPAPAAASSRRFSAPAMRAITVRLGAGTRHSGLIDPGDRVDVVLTVRTLRDGPDNVLSRTILEDVRVLAVDRRIGSDAVSAEGGGEVTRTEIVTATLEVLPAQTGLLALGEYEGELALAVRPLAEAGQRTDRGGIVELNSLLASPEPPPPEEPEMAPQKTVRVIRGTEVTGESFEMGGSFEIDAGPAAFENAGVQTGP